MTVPAPEGLGGTVRPLDLLADVIESAAARPAKPCWSCRTAAAGRARRRRRRGRRVGAVRGVYARAVGRRLRRTARRRPSAGPDDALVVGLSAPVGLAAAAAAYRQAEQALSVARRRGRALVEHEELAAGSVLPLLADDAVRAFADGCCGRCANTTRPAAATWSPRCAPGCPATASGTRRPPTWACTGTRCATGCAGWRRSSGRSLDDPDVRMELWLALKATG